MRHSISSLLTILKSNLNTFWYDLEGVYHIPTFCDNLCGSSKAFYMKEHDRKTDVRHEEIQWFLENRVSADWKKYDFEITCGEQSAWLEVSHKYIDLSKLNDGNSDYMMTNIKA